MSRSGLGLASIAELGGRAFASSAEAIVSVAEIVQRLTAIDITAVSEITTDGRYVFRGLEKRPAAPVERDDAIPYEWSLCSCIHAGRSPASVRDAREVPALWAQWLRLKQGLGVDWDILGFCTRDIRLPDGSLFGTLCVHHLEPRSFSPDEEALLEVLARLLGDEIGRERAASELSTAVGLLVAAEARRVELVEELRHELRAPLQVIDGYAEGMLDGVIRPDPEQFALIRREAGRAMRLLDDLADLTELEAARDEAGAPLEPERLDLAVLEMHERLAPLAESAGIRLVAEVEPALVAASRKRLEQVVVNLVRNSLRATQRGDGSRIRLSVRIEDATAALSVEDDGPGIQRPELDRVFERFYRGSSEREQGDGSGLGLTITRRIVEAAGGDIAAEALEPRGTRIIARMPLAGQTAAGADEPGV